VFDTARAYGNETLVARAIRGVAGARVVTKGGMARTAGAWIPDGRARTIRADCEASLAALDGVPIDLYLLHAPDQRVAWKTTLRALAALVDDGLVPRVGVCNVNRTQLDVAVEHAPVSAVQVALSTFDHTAIRDRKAEALHFHLDIRRPEVHRTVGVGAPGRRQTLPDLVRDYLRGRPLPAELDREEFVRLGGDLMDAVERDLAGT